MADQMGALAAQDGYIPVDEASGIPIGRQGWTADAYGAFRGNQVPKGEALATTQTPSEKINRAVTDAVYNVTGSDKVAGGAGTAAELITGSLPLVGLAQGLGDAGVMASRGEYLPAAMVGAASVLPIPGAKTIAKAGGRKVAEEFAQAGATKAMPMGALADVATYKAPGIGHNMPPPDVQGHLNPLANKDVLFNGKAPKDFTPEDWQAFGQHHGVDNLGPLSPVQTFKDMHGNEFGLPGGTEGKWTYYDMLHMKANPINPANVDRALHAEMQRKLGRTMTPEKLTDDQVWNGLVFGMTSPNNPLFPNQVTASRLRLRTPEMLDDLASMAPVAPVGGEVTTQQRKIVSDQIAERFGLNKGAEGGLGTRGTADYSRVAEMAGLFRQNPNFFRKDPNESWAQAVERISSQLPGLSMKTGSFGTVWQAPADAAISAIDRHMAKELQARGGIFPTPAAQTQWEQNGVALWNKREMNRQLEELKKYGEIRKRADIATSFDDMVTKSGSDGHLGEMLLNHVGQELTPKFRMANGEINPNIPSHLANAQWIKEPESVFKMGKAYKQALDVNQKLADENGLNLFMSQWMEWDRIRNRFEPHENMFPGLSKLPAMSVEQLRDVNLAHKQTGHKTYGKTDTGTLQPTRPFQGSPSAMGYLGMGGVLALPAAAQVLRQNEEGAQ
jgi:hypothetical protein